MYQPNGPGWLDAALIAQAYGVQDSFTQLLDTAAPRLARQLQVYRAVAHAKNLLHDDGIHWPDLPVTDEDRRLCKEAFCAKSLAAAEWNALDATWRVATRGGTDRF